MLGLLSQITFLNPWILAAAVTLPVLWYLLRVTPPAPKTIFFPATRFLSDLIADRVTPSKTPWWLLLLRILIVSCVILALAKPVMNVSSGLPGQSDIRIVMDTGWEAAQNWRDQMRTAEEALNVADRENRNVYITSTTLQSGQSIPFAEGPMSAAQAKTILRGLKPQSWPSDYEALADFIADQDIDRSVYTLWMGSGLRSDGFNRLVTLFQGQGGLTYTSPESENMPILITSGEREIGQEGLPLRIRFSDADSPARPFTLHALDRNNRVIGFESISVKADDNTVFMPIPDQLTQNIARIKLLGVDGVGSVLLMDDQFKKRSVGIVSTGPDEDAKPLIDSVYYLRRALEPYSILSTGSIDTLIEENPSVIIMPDIGALPPSTLNNLETWVKNGGLLLRFAGDAMSAADNFLTPVPLRRGTRSLEGDITWSEPQSIAPFPETSPLFDIQMRDDITVRQQILAEPVADLDEKTWARLQDGTPIITASGLERGLLVLVHTTASADWSDLALSGTYVEVLRRIITLSNATLQSSISQTSLQPISVLDGFAEFIEPKNVKPIPAQDFDTLIPNPDNPPGLYGQSGTMKVLNLGERLEQMNIVRSLPSGTTKAFYNKNYEQDLMPFFLSLAFILLLLDWIIMIAMSGRLRFTSLFKARTASALFIALSLLTFAAPAHAQNSDHIEYAGELYMGYIRSGDTNVDDMAERGLNALARVLTQRTSVEPKGTVALNPETDELSFFPLVYWPVSDTPRELSDTALSNLQSYLDNGGSILFDTRDQHYAVQNNLNFATSDNTRALREMIGSLNIPSLVPAPDDHVLRKSFYLLDGFPGRYSGGQLWVESQSANGRDGVSSIIIGGHDWASAWAAEQSGGTLRPYISGGPRQQEMAYRFGVNLMMYALTGNYKADQVHLPYILERLGQ